MNEWRWPGLYLGVAVVVGACWKGVALPTFAEAQQRECAFCHLDVEADFGGSVHAQKEVTCVNCHGDSWAHIAAEDNSVKPDRRFPPADVREACSPCHQDLPADCSEGKTEPAAPGCTNCHDPHTLERRVPDAVGNGTASVPYSPEEWPMIRRDPQNTAASPLVGRMREAPEPRARYCLGGSPAGNWQGIATVGSVSSYLLVDLNQDGLEELVTAAGGPVRAFQGRGQELWRTLLPRGQPTLLAAGDLDGDGVPEIVCSTGLPATIHLLSGQDGRLLWERSFDEQVYFENGTRLADLDGDGRPELFLLGNAPAENSRRVGWVFRFHSTPGEGRGGRGTEEEGRGRKGTEGDGERHGDTETKVPGTLGTLGTLGTPEMVWGGQPLPFNPHFRPQTIVADIDGDGRPEIVVASKLPSGALTVAAFDGLTGALKRQADFPNGDRNYGHLQAIKTGDKPQLDLLVIGMLGQAHITFLANDAEGMKEVWHVNDTFQIPYNPVADVDGDGQLEVVYTRISDSGEKPTPQNTILTVRDLLTGTLKRELPGLRLQGLVDLDGDGRIDLIATTVPDDQILFYAGEEQRRTLPYPGARLCLVADRPPLHIMNEALEDRSGYHVFARDLNGNGVPEVFVATPDALLGLDGRSLEVTFRFALDAGPPLPSPLVVLGGGRLLDRQADTLMLAGEAGLILVGADGQERARVRLHNCPPRVAVAARLQPNAPLTVLVPRPDGTVVALDGPSLAQGRVEVRWSQPSLGGFEAPTVADMDGDGNREMLLCDQKTAEPVLVDAAGQIKQRFPALPTDGTPLVTGTAVVGRFDESGRLMIGAVSGVGPNDGLARWTTMDPRDGRILWQREGGAHPRRTPCVWDLNGDGVDDLVWMHFFDLIAVDGRTGANLWAVPDRVPGYHLVSIADLPPLEKGDPPLPPLEKGGSAGGYDTPSILLSGGYMAIYRFDLKGQEVWRTPPLHYNAGSAAALTDVDGDGRWEFGAAFTDRFACYDAANGQVKWTIPLPGKGSDVAAADIDGDGQAEFLFGCADGNLYAVKSPAEGSEGQVLWKVPFGAPVGPPTIADLDGDGQAEILVCTQDGWLHALAART